MRLLFATPMPYRLMRFTLGMVFVYSGLSKSLDLNYFSGVINAFGILPQILGFPAALSGKKIRRLTSDRGRGPQMNAGARAAKGDLFFFVHADSRPDPAGIREMTEAWQASNSALFCGAFDLAIDSNRPVFRIIERTASLRSRLTQVPYGDQGIFISRALFEAVGGFPDQPLMEDVGLMSAVKKTGIRPVILSQKILTSARRWTTRGIVKTTLSNWMFISLYALGVPPEKLAEWYYS